MLCSNCGKKIEYEAKACRYCKEPIITEGFAPIGVVVKKEKPPEPAAEVYVDTYAEPKEDTGKKIAFAVAGGICALLVVFAMSRVLLPKSVEPENPRPNREKSEKTELDDAGFYEEDKFDDIYEKIQKGKVPEEKTNRN